MSRVHFANQKSFLHAKISREQQQLSILQNALNNEVVNNGNKNRLYNLMKNFDQWQNGKELLGKHYNGPIFNLDGMNNNWNYLMKYGLNHCCYGNNFLGSDFSNLMGISNCMLDDAYKAMAIHNDYNDLFDDNALSNMKTTDIESQIDTLNSLISADQKELENLGKGEEKAIEQSASKYA